MAYREPVLFANPCLARFARRFKPDRRPRPEIGHRALRFHRAIA